MNVAKGRFIVVDGIPGSGKSTIIREIKAWLEKQDVPIFDLLPWTNDHDDPPTLADVGEAEALFTFEPTKQWIGRAIRHEMSQTDMPYSATALAQAFALDRLLQYRRLIIPAIKAGKTIIQDRSVSTSLAIQPRMPNGPRVEYLKQLDGNALALQYAPHHLVLTSVDINVLSERLNRDDDSKGVFEDIELLRTISEVYKSEEFRSTFTERGTQIHDIDTNQSIVDTLALSTNLFKTLLTEDSLQP
jgi:thymidylate kinase